MYSNQTARDLLETRASLTVSETAEILRISRSSVYSRVADGTIPSRRVGDRIVIPADDVRRFLGNGVTVR